MKCLNLWSVTALGLGLALATSVGCAAPRRAGGVEFARTRAYGRPASCPETPITYQLGRSGLVGGDAMRCSFEDLGASDTLRIRGVVLAEQAGAAALRPVSTTALRIEVEGLARLDRAPGSGAMPRVRERVEARRMSRHWRAEVGPQGHFEVMARGARPPLELRAVEVASGRVVARARAEAGQIVRVEDPAKAPGSPANVWRQIRVQLIIPAKSEARAAAGL